MMRMAASLTVTGFVGFLILEALKILLAPLAAWLLVVAAFGLKIVAIAVAVLGACLAIGVGVYVYRRTRRSAVQA